MYFCNFFTTTDSKEFYCSNQYLKLSQKYDYILTFYEFYTSISHSLHPLHSGPPPPLCEGWGGWGGGGTGFLNSMNPSEGMTWLLKRNTNWHCFLRNAFCFKKYILVILVDTLCLPCPQGGWGGDGDKKKGGS